MRHTNKLRDYLKDLGLSIDEIAVYLYLVEHGESAVLAISKGIDSGRTKLYPVLESLTEKQLVTANERHYGSSYSALPLESVEFLAQEKLRKAESLLTTLPSIQQTLQSIASPEVGGTKIFQYKGVEGLKQANYNLTKAKGEYRVFEMAPLEGHRNITKHFARKMQQRTHDAGLTTYDLTNNPKRREIADETDKLRDKTKIAYIDPKVFEIEFETYIYDDVVGVLNYEHDDLVCLEIHNPALASQQKQLFDLVWAMATEI
ncbi:MAG: helix-turn-helix domain-containing protein [Patescibacteria group bacterium]